MFRNNNERRLQRLERRAKEVTHAQKMMVKFL